MRPQTQRQAAGDGPDFELLEARGFGLLVTDLGERTGGPAAAALHALAAECVAQRVAGRPRFEEAAARLAAAAAAL